MEHTVEKLEGSKVKLTFTVAAEEFESALQKAYLKMRGQVNVPGFRKGKAPRKLIENMFGDKVFYDDALEILVPDAYTEALEKNDWTPALLTGTDFEKFVDDEFASLRATMVKSGMN